MVRSHLSPSDGADSELTERLARAATLGDIDPSTAGFELSRGIDVARLKDHYDTGFSTDTLEDHAAVLSQSGEEGGTARAQSVVSNAERHSKAGVAPSTYIGSYSALLDQLIEDAFAGLEGETAKKAREQLQSGLSAALVDMQLGVDEFAGEGSSGQAASRIGLAQTLEALPFPAFLIGDKNTVLAYNEGICSLLSLGEGHREFLGADCRETIAAATYTDGSRHHTLADKVAENPMDGAQHWDIERIDDDYGHSDVIVYQDRSVTKDQDGNETHIEFLAIPMFDEGGELEAVLELVWDRSQEVIHKRALEGLITEVAETLQQIGDGELRARAEFADEHDVLESDLLALTGEINEMAANFQEIITEVDRTTSDLAGSIDQTTDRANRIDDRAQKQASSLENAAEEMSDVSAAMEEVAATSSEVAEAADTALDEAKSGMEAGSDAQDVTGDVLETSDSLVETVEELDEYVEEIGTVVEVIDEVADQTNMLALNANIEAARAGKEGEGFAVVAEEVKSLATETQEHTDEIATRVEQIQDQTETTVAEVETSHQRMQAVAAEITEIIDALEAFSEEIQRAADGIRQVSDANDSQASAVETVAAEIDDIRDRSIQVADAVDDIVAETERQEEIVYELSNHVQELSSEQE